ncbi:hypothetical protein [Muricomes intestini]|uniref:hypothetical protein n=1 Tax=Muricomes intestini TaxID=1796634 RepID=UPI002FDCEAFF
MMYPTIDEYKKSIIIDILQSSNTLEKVDKFKLFKDRLNECRIFLFDEKYSNFGHTKASFLLPTLSKIRMAELLPKNTKIIEHCLQNLLNKLS